MNKVIVDLDAFLKGTDALKALADLRAERDEQKRRADYLSKDFDRDIKMYQAEVAELRADLAAERDAAREESKRLRWSCFDKDAVTRKMAEIYRIELAAANARSKAAEARLTDLRQAYEKFLEATGLKTLGDVEDALNDLATTKAELAKTESDATWKISDLQHDLCDMRLRAEAAEARERVKDELLKDTRPFCYGCAYVKDGRLADRYATKKGNE
jgi:phosphoenolpyruvate carboxylase